MPRSTIPFFLISAFLLALLSGCGANPAQGLTSVKQDKTVYAVPYFADAGKDYVYKTNISVYGHELSGILIFKKVSDTVHRIVFTTEFGNKLMDFEIGANHFKTNFIVDELNRKILVKTLKEDFGLLLRKEFKVSQEMESAVDRIYISAGGKNSDYLFESKTDAKLSKIAHYAKRKEKFNIGFTSENDIFAEKILIQHLNLKLKIELNSLSNQ